MVVWLRDEKTGIECGVNSDGDLFLGTNSSGYNLPDTMENREKIIADYCWQTGSMKPIIAANGAPIKYDGSVVDFSR